LPLFDASKGLLTGTVMVGLEQKLRGGRVPWTLHHQHSNNETLKSAAECKPIVYLKPDRKLTFDRLSRSFCQTPTTKKTSRRI
jgi:electron-transferring-flavoprotein dehydrogenase